MEDVKKFTIKSGENMVFNANAETRVNGPYTIKTWDMDKKQFEIVQNPKWWGDKKPMIKRIVPTESADENISYIQWQNNEMDIAFLLSNIREQIRTTDPETFTLIPTRSTCSTSSGRGTADGRHQRAQGADACRRLEQGHRRGLGGLPQRSADDRLS